MQSAQALVLAGLTIYSSAVCADADKARREARASLDQARGTAERLAALETEGLGPGERDGGMPIAAASGAPTGGCAFSRLGREFQA